MTSAVLEPDDERLEQFRKLTEISRALTYALSLDEVLQLAARRAAELLATDKSLLMLQNDDGLLAVRASFGLDAAVTEQFREPLDETLVRRLQKLLDVTPERFLGVPLVANGEVMGILAVALKSGPPTDAQEWLLSAMADQAAVALEKSRLDETAEFRERLIGIVSHDLRNPVAAILLGTQALLRHQELSERSGVVVRRIKSSADRAARMIRDLLDFTQARIGGGISVRRQHTELTEIAFRAAEEVEAGNPGRHIDVVADELITGQFDADRIEQVLANLLANAVNYSPPDSRITLSVTTEGDQRVLTVHNDGEPIDPALLPLLFEPMVRGTSANAAARSVGLGLYIVRHLVEAHDGTVTVTSTAGSGTTFTVRLPAGH